MTGLLRSHGLCTHACPGPHKPVTNRRWARPRPGPSRQSQACSSRRLPASPRTDLFWGARSAARLPGRVPPGSCPGSRGSGAPRGPPGTGAARPPLALQRERGRWCQAAQTRPRGATPRSSRHAWQWPRQGSELSQRQNWAKQNTANAGPHGPPQHGCEHTHCTHIHACPHGPLWPRVGWAAGLFRWPGPALLTTPLAAPSSPRPSSRLPVPRGSRPAELPPGPPRCAGQGGRGRCGCGSAALRPLACGSREHVPLGRALGDDGRGLHSGRPVEGQRAGGSDLS